MGYRDDAQAMRTRIETLELERARAVRRAAEAEREIGELRHAIVRLRAGFRDEAAMRMDRHLLATEAFLPIAGVLGALLTVAVATSLGPYQFHGDLQLDATGVTNFVSQLASGGLATFLLTLAAMPLAVLPSVASVGMHMRRPFGWYAAVAAWGLWCLVCPPLGVYGLYALTRKKVRDLFFVEPMSVPRVRVGGVEESGEGPAGTAAAYEASRAPSADEVVRRSQRERLARRKKAS